jgi:alpha-L-arabinofuranosidase
MLAAVAMAGAASIEVQVDKPGHKIAPTLWGIFFEDINLSADGGIYPELVRNRSFEDSDQPEFWKLSDSADSKSEMKIESSRPLNPLNRHYLRLKVEGGARLENEGYWGMNVVKGETYTFKVAVRGDRVPLAIKLVGAGGEELATGEVKDFSNNWNYYTAVMTATASDPKARLQIVATGNGTVDLDMVSLMPTKTWKEHGLRTDLAESIDALKPSFVRFPGGCWVEGDDMAHMYHWKNTIGDVDARTPLWNIWKYNATHGLGFHEYLQMCEDLGATPLFDINCGMSHKEVIPVAQMGQWVQDALDAIEYANGDTNTFWGGLRAKHGHPAPFNLHFMEIGNENGGAAYRDRWPLFVKAIKAAHPEMQLVANHWQGGYPKDPAPDVVDEHYYNTPEFFMRQAHHYDNYDRNGPKIFVGEYAVTRNTGKGNLRGAIGEAAFMTGIERNSDVVIMASYAPLFVNLNHRAWNPDLINFDSSRWYGLPSYYVQKLFSEHRGDVVLPTAVESGAIQESEPAGRFGVGTWNTAAEFKEIKVTSPEGKVLFTAFNNDERRASASSPSDSATAAEDNGSLSRWRLLGDGAAWSAQGGALRQTAEREFVRALAGDKSWKDYTLELKARKISGREGFLVLFHIEDNEDRNWWNIAGWNNSAHGIELGGTHDQKSGSIETGRWYDIKVELAGRRIRCWLDGKLIHDISGRSESAPSLLASATRDEKNGDVIVKVVNAAPTSTDVEVNLAGAPKLSGNAEAIVLASDTPRDENTIDQPTKVSPKSERFNVSAPKFTRSFPGNSLTVLRIGAQR